MSFYYNKQRYILNSAAGFGEQSSGKPHISFYDLANM